MHHQSWALLWPLSACWSVATRCWILHILRMVFPLTALHKLCWASVFMTTSTQTTYPWRPSERKKEKQLLHLRGIRCCFLNKQTKSIKWGVETTKELVVESGGFMARSRRRLWITCGRAESASTLPVFPPHRCVAPHPRNWRRKHTFDLVSSHIKCALLVVYPPAL